MTIKKDSITTKLLSKEVVEENKAAIDIVDFYTNVASIVERTHIAMGKKSSFKISYSSTISEKLKNNVFASTH